MKIIRSDNSRSKYFHCIKSTPIDTGFGLTVCFTQFADLHLYVNFLILNDTIILPEYLIFHYKIIQKIVS